MEERRAYWQYVSCNCNGDSGVYCSNCDFFISDYTENMEEYYYCPKCGYAMGETIKEQKYKTYDQMAIDLLNAFTKTWCIDREETQKSGEPKFRCKACRFKVESGKVCAVKAFAYDIDGKYTRDVNFGGMGLL